MSSTGDRVREFDVPGKLWSLGDIMERFRAATVVTVMSTISRVVEMIGTMNAAEVPKNVAADRALMKSVLSDARETIEELNLPFVLQEKFKRLIERLDSDDPDTLLIVIDEFRNDIVVELTQRYFLTIDMSKIEYYTSVAPFGEDVSSRFPEAVADIQAASRCFALDEWTAMVFHLMRVLELGLHTLATLVNLPRDATELENWKNIIDLIEKKIRDMEKLPKSAKKNERIASLSQAAIQFRYFKDAWRNHVAHSRVSYDHRAIVIWNHVSSFMHEVAELASADAAE